MNAVVLIGAILMFVLMLVCMGKEKKLSAFYGEVGICGRWYAFFSGYLMLTGVVGIAATIINLCKGQWAELLGTLIAAALFFPIGFFMFKRAYAKCPDELKKRFFWDVAVITLGVSTRISFFFLLFIIPGWFSSPPSETYTTDDGRTVYAHPGSDVLYDEDGIQVGRKTGHGTAQFYS